MFNSLCNRRLRRHRHGRDDALHERHEAAAGRASHLGHVLVVQGHGREATGPVADTRDADRLRAHVVGRHELVHRGHADHVRARPPEHLHLGDGLVARPGHGRVHAQGQLLPERARARLGVRPERRRADLTRVREARPERSAAGVHRVLPVERVGVQVVDEGTHEHERTGLVVEVHAPGGVGGEDHLRAEVHHGAHRVHGRLHVPTLVRVAAALHDEHPTLTHAAKPQLARVPRHLGHREVRDILVWEGLGVRERGLGERAEARAQNQPDARLAVTDPWLENLQRFFQPRTHR